jgi:hypothetical protein
VLGTGPSMSREIADRVRDRCRVIAVCNAYQIAPWAEALVCADRTWWRVHADSLAFSGRKFTLGKVRGSEKLLITDEFPANSNSGYRAMGVARDFGATRILLLGFDMHGSHYFGTHPAPLKNTAPGGFRRHIAQFRLWRGGCEVVNCTPNSALTQFPFSSLEAELA